jgi:ribosomal-protein-alanine N-acetyltransferase
VTTKDSVNGSSDPAAIATPDGDQMGQGTGSGDLQVVGRDYALRLATHEDARQLFELGSDPAVTRFFSWGPYTSVDQPLAYIDALKAKRDDGSLLEFVIVENESGMIVGVTGLTEFSRRDRRAVVGSWLGHKHWGTGVNVASKSLVLALAFHHLGLERVSAYSHVRNGRSKAALERIGFINEGILHGWHVHRGEPQDVNIHCLLREQFLRSEIAGDEITVSGAIPAAFAPLGSTS